MRAAAPDRRSWAAAADRRSWAAARMNVGRSERGHREYANGVYRANRHEGVNPRVHQDRGRINYSLPINTQRGILGSPPPNFNQSFHLPPPFKRSFSSLFSKPKDLHPSDPISPNPNSEDGWTQVINRKRRYQSKKPSLVQAPPSRKCFLCGNHNHLARSCRMSDIVCFRCNSMGHKSRECPTANKVTPIVQLPPIIKDHISELSNYAIFYVGKGLPSLSELREMLSFRFNVRNWTHKVVRAGGNSFLIEFPEYEMMEQAEEWKLVDMGGFKGRFRRWREDLGQKTIPEPVLTWVEIVYLPYHLWEWEFLQIILGDIGECISCSNDVAFRSHFSNCKVLLKVRDLSLIPKEIRFRSFSPIDNSLLEGWAYLKAIGKPIKERDFNNKPEVREHILKWEGEDSSSSGRGDKGSSDVISVQSPMITGIPNEEGGNHKGKMVKPQFSNSKKAESTAPRKESLNLAGSQQQNRIPLSQPINQLAITDGSPEITNVFWNGNPITVERNQWEKFLRVQGVGGSREPFQRVSPSSSSDSSKDSIIEGSNSVSIPPGFEPFVKPKKKKLIGRSRLISNPISAQKYRKFLAASRSRGSSAKMGKSSSASVSLPINDKSVADITSIAANCGLKEPIPLEGIIKIKSLEVVRSEGA